MKNLFLVLMTAIAAVALSGCGNSAKPGSNSSNQPAPNGSLPPKIDSMTNARLNFGDNCAICHKVDGTGGPITIKGEKLNVPNLGVGHALRHSDDDFVEQISNGGNGMPAFKDKLNPDQIKDLVAFVRKEFQNGAPAAK